MNGQAECTSKVLRTLLTKLVSENRTYWDEHMSIMLFSYKIAYNVTRKYTPSRLMYGLHPLMPIEYIVPVVGGEQKDKTLMKV